MVGLTGKRYFGSRNGTGGKHNVIKARVLLLLYLLDRAGYGPQTHASLADKLPGVSLGYLQARLGDFERFKLIKRRPTMGGSMRLCFEVSIAAAGIKFIDDIPPALRQKLVDQIVSANPYLRFGKLRNNTTAQLQSVQARGLT